LSVEPSLAKAVSGPPTMKNYSIRRDVAALVLISAVLSAAASAEAQTPVDFGFRDFPFGTTATPAPTGEKPESKLWFNDGIWWGSLFNAQANEYRIYRFNVATNGWTDTGTTLDTRPNSKADALWDGQSLYIVSHVFSTNAQASASSSNWARLYRFSYNSTTKAYALDSGFPVNVTRGTAEALTIAKDSAQRLWITHVEGGKVKVNWSQSSDLDWGVPVNLPVDATAMDCSTDDISSVVAFGGNRIGLMWSNQTTKKLHFVFRYDVDPPTVWQPVETVFPGSGCSSGSCADDHISLKAAGDGRLFAAVKTSLTANTSPQLVLVARDSAATWTGYTLQLVQEHHTRAILLLDEQNHRLLVFSASESGDAVYVKSSPMDAIAFPSGHGEFFIKSASDDDTNNPTSTKQNVNGSTGALVLASDEVTRFYLHNYLTLSAPAAPADPTSLLAMAVTSTRVNLTWTDNSSNETTYRIERSSGGGSFAEIGTVGANATSYSDTTALPNTTYTYQVRAENNGLFSGYSNQSTATTPQTAPAAPTGLGATAITSTHIDLAWTDNATNETAFHVERSSGGGSFTEIATVAANATSYSDTTVVASTAYSYRVRAENSGVFSGYSNVANATTPGGGGGASSIKDITFEGGSLTAPITGADRISGTVTLLTSSPLKQTYSARISAGNSYLEESFGATTDLYLSLYVRLNALPTADVRLVQITNGGTTVGNMLVRASGRLRLRVDATTIGVESAPLVVGQLYRVGVRQKQGPGGILQGFLASNDDAFGAPFAATTTGTWTTAADRLRFGATTSTAVDVIVDDIRLDANAMPPPSSGGNPAAPAAPTGLAATAITSTRIDLTWTDNASNETAFHIERSSGGGSFVEIATMGANATGYSDTTVVASTAYNYQVRAENTGVFSDYSNVASATTPGGGPIAPGAPTSLGASAVASTHVDLTWTDNATNETAFHIERSSSGGNFVEIATVSANATTYSDTTVVASTAYGYRVRAENTGVFSGYSNVFSTTTPPGGGGASSIKDITFEDGSLTAAGTGADKVSGTVTLITTTPLKGTFSAGVATGSSYLEESFGAANDLYLSFYVRLNALPTADVRLLQITNGGANVGNVLVRASGRLRLRVDSTNIGVESAPLVVGPLYRIGVRQKQGAGGNSILQGFLAANDDVFAAPFAATTTGTWTTAADRLRLGATTGTVVNVALDDIRLDGTAMPPPSSP
jgi:hypothetical protein